MLTESSRERIRNLNKKTPVQKFKIGETVFVNSTWNKEDECIITDYYIEPRTGVGIYTVNSKNLGGIFGIESANVFSNRDEAHKAFLESYAKMTDKYKEEIKSLKDLIMFPLEHCVSGDDTDNEAKEAYCERAYELIGIKFR